MNLSAHPIIHHAIHELLRFHSVQPVELLRNDHRAVVPAPILRTSVAGVQVGLVHYFNVGRFERVPQTRFKLARFDRQPRLSPWGGRACARR